MEQRPLGCTGVSVSKLCLGAMMFGDWGTKDHDESIQIIHRALDAGINFVDTADVYSRGESEVIVGKALAGGRRDDVVLASKAHMPANCWPHGAGHLRFIHAEPGQPLLSIRLEPHVTSHGTYGSAAGAGRYG